MPHLVFFSTQIKFGVMTRLRPAGNSLDHTKPGALQLLHFVRIIRKQSQFVNAERFERLRGKFIVARIRGEAEFAVRLHRIQPRVLQLVRLQLVNQPDAAALLRQIYQDPRSFFRDLL